MYTIYEHDIVCTIAKLTKDGICIAKIVVLQIAYLISLRDVAGNQLVGQAMI